MVISRTVKFAPLLLCAGFLASAAAQAEGPAGHVVTAPDAIKWVDNPSIPGAKTAVIYGDPKKSGAYIIRNKFPANTIGVAHTHPDTRQITILSVTWNFGHGENADPAKATKLPAGTFFVEPAGSPHYNFTTTEEVVIQVSGNGPSGSTPVKK